MITELGTVFAAAGEPLIMLRMDNGPELISAVLQQVCDDKVALP